MRRANRPFGYVTAARSMHKWLTGWRKEIGIGGHRRGLHLGFVCLREYTRNVTCVEHEASTGAWENTMAADVQHAHHLLDQLGPGPLAAVVHLLETIVSLEDRDALSDAERKAVSEADEWLKHNQPIPHEEVLAEFGLTMADWVKMGHEPSEEPPRHNG